MSNVNTSSTIQKIMPVKQAESTHDLIKNGKTLPVDAEESGVSKEKNEIKDSKNFEKLSEAVRVINNNIQAIKRELHFSIDDKSGETVIKVIDSETEELVRQIPNEDALKVARRLVEGLDIDLFNDYS